MADYRFSAKIIKRSNGQSAVASAAYRAGTRLVDDRTGEIHDYGRKGGVIHSVVMTPEATPEWMHDRAQLWNTVETVERRGDAQLAREIQLSLPHELDQAQRKALLLDFVQEQFVDRGMIADVAIHAPSDQGDQRNHHAHVMLTMRELTGDGFGKKARDWNSPDLLNEWREQWGVHQNRALERHGHNARVDHRSYEAQGIDREPTQHLGPNASDMERNGKASRIGDENRQIANDNAERAADHMAMAEIAREKWKFGQWADFKRSEIENAQDLANLDLAQKHHRQSLRLEERLRAENDTIKATIAAEVQAIDRRLQAVGVRKVLRDVFGRTKSDSTTRAQMQATIAGIEKRETEQREALAKDQAAERTKEDHRQATNREKLEKGIQTARERREAKGWAPRKPQQPKPAEKQPERRQEKPATPAPAPFPISVPLPKTKPAPEVRESDAPSLADKKRSAGNKLDDRKGAAKRPWKAERSEKARPWKGDRKRGASRTRQPNPDGGKK